VNIYEKMANVMMFQKEFEAGVIVIKTYDEILKTTLYLKR